MKRTMKGIRTDAGLTREEMCSVLKQNGVSMTPRQLMSRENGNTKWTAIEVAVIMDIFDIKDIGDISL